MSNPSSMIRMAVLSAALLAATTMPGMAGGFFGNWYFNDGSQQRVSRTVAGAAPNIIATSRGVRCDYRYVVRNGKRIKYEVCE